MIRECTVIETIVHGRPWAALAILITLLTTGLTAGSAGAQTAWDISKVVGPAKCAECHKQTAAIWKNTQHFKTFTDLPRRKEANEIAKKMGLKRIKAGSLCLDCHFTTVMKGDKRKAVAGISCESCHGPGADYLKVHSEFSGKKKETESAAERDKRWADSEAAGMIRPRDMYRWAKNCYGCHTVPQEELVNKGGHTAGSAFNLVTWSQGEIRHNVWYTADKSNPLATPERRRLMYVVGLAVELETALRAVGEARVKAKYAVAMAKRAKRAKIRFAKVAKVLSEPEIADIAKAAKSAKLKLNNKEQLSAAADRIADATKRIVERYDGSSFAAIAPLIPGEDKFKGKPVP
ncbi:MAG: cytochrome c family protein [Alphaproteobacteria bacterium]